MKKYIILPLAFVFASMQLSAQQVFKLNKSTGKLVLHNIPNLSIEGYDGKEVIFTVTENAPAKNTFGTNQNQTDDPRARGLSALSNNGFDNTGIGLAIQQKDSETIASPVNNFSNSDLRIKLPNSMSLSVQNGAWPISIHDSNAISIRNSKSPIDISVQLENCKLENVTGPLSVKTLTGNIEIKLNNQFVSPLSAYSIRGFIDVTVNNNSTADLTMHTSGGGIIYADKNLKLETTTAKNTAADKKEGIKVDNVQIFTTRPSGDKIVKGTGIQTEEEGSRTISLYNPALNRYSSVSLLHSGASSFNGTLNGGGGKMVLQSVSGNIYLRK